MKGLIATGSDDTGTRDWIAAECSTPGAPQQPHSFTVNSCAWCTSQFCEAPVTRLLK
jgi:hypothetical protein